jgi:hypothetical protein
MDSVRRVDEDLYIDGVVVAPPACMLESKVHGGDAHPLIERAAPLVLLEARSRALLTDDEGGQNVLQQIVNGPSIEASPLERSTHEHTATVDEERLGRRASGEAPKGHQ